MNPNEVEMFLWKFMALFARPNCWAVLSNPPVNQILFHDATNWLRDNQTVVGCVIIGVSTICLALAGILKSKGDKAAASRKKEEIAKSKRYYFQYTFALLVCCGWTAYGTWWSVIFCS